jgi:hypothetical protein
MHPADSVAPADSFWTAPVNDQFARLGATPDGLSAAQAARRLGEHGRNAVAESPRRRIIARIGHRLTDPLAAILMVAGLVAGLTGDLASCAIIFVILSVSIALAVSPASAVFGFTVLPWPVAVAIAILVFAYLAAAEYLKHFAVGVAARHRHRHHRHRHHRRRAARGGAPATEGK